jgi:hypothetical protein
MKTTPRQVGLIVVILGSILAACSGAPQPDEVLPTLAQLPTVTPIGTATSVPTETLIIPKNTAQVESTDITPNPIILPGTLMPTATTASTDAVGVNEFPAELEVGAKITLQGTLVSQDTNSGVAVLTNDKGQTVNLLVDPFTAMTANNQVVEISGTVEQQPSGTGNAVRVSEIRMINGSSALATATDAQADLQLSAVPSASP